MPNIVLSELSKNPFVVIPAANVPTTFFLEGSDLQEQSNMISPTTVTMFEDAETDVSKKYKFKELKSANSTIFTIGGTKFLRVTVVCAGLPFNPPSSATFKITTTNPDHEITITDVPLVGIPKTDIVVTQFDNQELCKTANKKSSIFLPIRTNLTIDKLKTAECTIQTEKGAKWTITGIEDREDPERTKIIVKCNESITFPPRIESTIPPTGMLSVTLTTTDETVIEVPPIEVDYVDDPD